jgi:hypothetical protein
MASLEEVGMKTRRVHRRRKRGLFNPDAPFWRGERAEDIVKARVAGYKTKRKSTKRKGK